MEGLKPQGGGGGAGLWTGGRGTQSPSPTATVFLPSSLTSESRDLRAKSLRVAWVARALAVFRVEEAVIYRARPDESRLVTTLLRYMETPQYLRKHLFPRQPELREAGILPPLRTPHHPLGKRVGDLKVGEVREGVVLRDGVDIGVNLPARLQGPLPNGRATVRVVSVLPLAVVPSEPPPRTYWGYRVREAPGLVQALEEWRGPLLLTSRRGQPYNGPGNLPPMAKLGVVFGSPDRGLPEMLAEAGRRPEEFGPLVATLEDQGVATVRVEEALWATLARVSASRGRA